MSILDLNGNIMNDEDGLNIINGSTYKVRIAKTTKQNEEVDFRESSNETKGKYLIYPSSVGLSPTTETLSKEYIGTQTSEHYLGSTTYAGDITFGAFPNTNSYYSSLIWANVITKETKGSIICINSDKPFSIYFNKNDENKISFVEIIRENENSYTSNFINIFEGATQKYFIEELNKITNIKAMLIIGNEDNELNFDTLLEECDDELVLSFNRVGFIETSIFSEEEKSKYPKYQNIITPRFGETQYYNLAISNNNNIDGVQYIGCESKSINFNFANKSITTISSSLWALDEKEIKAEEKLIEDRVEERDVVMAQTSKYPTKLYINGVEATSITDISIAFEWTKEEKYNISAKRYDIPNSKFTLTFSGNAIFNSQSKEFFYNKVLNGDRQSFVIYSNTKFKNKEYPFIFISNDVSGSPSTPTIEPKELYISLNNFKAIEKSEDKNSNYLLTFTDREDLF